MEGEKKLIRWSKTAVTDVGTGLLAEYAAGRLLDITSAYGSISTPGGDLLGMEELPDGRAHPLTIESVTKADSSVTVCVQVTSLGNDAPYKLDQIGIYAAVRDPGRPKPPAGTAVRDDKLLMVVEDVEDENGSKGVTIPAEADQLYTFKLYIVLTITNKDRLEVSISAAGIATIGAIHDAIDAHDKDPEAHGALLAGAMEAHGADQAAHPGLTARVRAVELELHGSETILAPEGDPTAETEGAKGQHYINCSTGAEFVCGGVTEKGYVWLAVDNTRSMRDILDEAASTAAQAKAVADGAAQAIAAVQHTISAFPSQSGRPTYNGSAQFPIWNNLALEMMDITYGEGRVSADEFQGETDAGTYKAYVTPKEGWTWGDKSADEREVPWTIQRASIAATPSVSAPMGYTGEDQAPVWKNYDPEQLIKTETPQTDVGTYATAFKPTPNYQWNNGDTSIREVPWAIDKAANTFSIAPSGAQDLYVGDALTIKVTSNSDAPITAVSSNEDYAAVSVDPEGKTVTIQGSGQGAATVTIASRGSASYTDASAAITVKVSRRTPAFSIAPSDSLSLAIGTSRQIAVTTDSDGAVSARSSAPGTATASASGKTVTISGASAGEVTITISVPQTRKYNAASAALTASVFKLTTANSTWEDIGKISDAGTASSFFAVGDTKSITLNGTVGVLALNNLVVDAFILGFDHNATLEGNNRIHWTIGKIDGNLISLCDERYGRNSTDGTKYFNMSHWGDDDHGGWKGCDLRYDILGSTNKAPSGYGSSPVAGRTGYNPASYDIVNSPVPNTLMAAMPQAVRKVMKTVTKYTDNVGNGGGDTAGNVTASVDYFFLLAEKEVFGGDRTFANRYEGNYQEQYDYFKAGNSKVMYKHDARATAVFVMLRSPRYNYPKYFISVNSSGSHSTHGPYNSGGLLACFVT